jgi:pimeloyl-ACP methyl ester carboxylesterase
MTRTELVRTSLGPVAVHRLGAGPPVVLLHANPGDSRDFAAVVPALAARFTTYAIDWPGYGASPAPAPPSAATATRYADLLPEIVADLGLRAAGLVGNSLGGFAAARLALQQPSLVSALVLVNSGGFTARTPLARAFIALKGARWGTSALTGRLSRLYLRRCTPVVREMLARDAARRGDRTAVSVEAAIWRSFASPDHDLRPRAVAITAPTMLAWGVRDPLLGADGRRARRAMPAARWQPFQTGHSPFAEAPDLFLAAVLPFLDRHLAAAALPPPDQ